MPFSARNVEIFVAIALGFRPSSSDCHCSCVGCIPAEMYGDSDIKNEADIRHSFFSVRQNVSNDVCLEHKGGSE